jgi:hypothetical protein
VAAHRASVPGATARSGTIADERQLALDLGRDPSDLSDLQFAGHRARLDRLDGVDFSAPTAPACECLGGPAVVADEFGERRCLHCGKEAP